jgi:hypothetical protein
MGDSTICLPLTPPPVVKCARAEMHRHEERLRNLRDLRIEGEIDQREYYGYKARIEAEREEVIVQLEEVGAIEELHRIEDVLEQVDNVFDLFGGNPVQQHLAFELLFERIEQRNGRIVGLTLRPWAQRLFFHITPPAGPGQPPELRGESAPDWIRTSTPKKAQALNLPRMPIPPPGLGGYYTPHMLLVNLSSLQVSKSASQQARFCRIRAFRTLRRLSRHTGVRARSSSPDFLGSTGAT